MLALHCACEWFRQVGLSLFSLSFWGTLLVFAQIPAFLFDCVRWPSADGRTVPLVIFGLIALVLPFIPSVILAWSEPDPNPLEEGMRGTA
jgi:hypothetical protein